MIKMREDLMKAICRDLHLSMDEIRHMDSAELDSHIEKIKRKKVRYPKGDSVLFTGRGSIYLMLRRFLNPQRINKRFSRI